MSESRTESVAWYFVLAPVVLWISINALAFAVDSSRGKIAEDAAFRRIGVIARGEEVRAESRQEVLQPEEGKLLPYCARLLVRLQESLADGPSSILGGMPVHGVISLSISFGLQLVCVAALSYGAVRVLLHK